MADSHGRINALATGIDLLKNLGCRLLYHLGDICDTGRPETAAACTRLIRENGILAVKGNNEHALAVNYSGQKDSPITQEVADFLGALPLVRTRPGAVLAHSLPFERELGLSAMVRIIEPVAAEFYFAQHPRDVLFRGHSHTPEIIRRKSGGGIATDPLPAGETVSLQDIRPCIITCGALMDNLCLLWNSRADWIHVLAFD